MATWDITTAAAALEFDTQNGKDSSCYQIDSNHVINFWSGFDTDGHVQVFEINTTTWGITTAATWLEFDTVRGTYNSCCQIDDNHFVNFWNGNGYVGYTQVFEVNTSTWAVTTADASLNYDTQNGISPSSFTIDSNHVINFWGGVNTDGYVQVFEINTTTWGITTAAAWLEFDTQNGDFNSCYQIDNNHFINFWEGALEHGYVQVFEVNTTTWEVTTAAAWLEFDTQNNLRNSCSKIDNNHFINSWIGETYNGYAQSFEVNTTTWAVTTAAAPLEFDTQSIYGSRCFKIEDNRVMNFWEDASTNGFSQILEVNTSTWAVTTSGAKFEFNAQLGGLISATLLDPSHVINFYTGADYDGYVQTFAVEVPAPPTVTTQAVDDIDATTATFNGNITATGVGNATVQGFYYKQASSGDPTSADSTVSSSGDYGTGAFDEAVTGLDADSDYRVAAFATNSAGTTIGSTVGFTTLEATPVVTTQAASSIDYTQAVLNGNITDEGGADVTTRGFYYATGSVTPTSSDTTISSTGSYSTGAYTETPTGLSTGQLYSATAFATSSIGTTTGSVVEFTTTTVTAPTVTTQAVSDITSLQAVLNGNITVTGGADATVQGFYYKEGAGDPTAGDTTISSSGTYSTGAFTETPTGLTPDTLHSVAAFATNSAGTTIGATVTFTTDDGYPTVSTQAVSSIAAAQAVLNGSIDDIGGINASITGFYYKQASSGDPTAADTTISTSGSRPAGAYTETPTGLDNNADYRVAFFATNLYGTTIGTTVGFTTLVAVPTVTTQAATAVDTESALLNGNITALGGENASARGFYWLEGSSGTPDNTDNVITTSGSYGTGAYTGAMTGLDPATAYRAVAFVTNSAGTSTGAVVNVVTLSNPPSGGRAIDKLVLGIGKLG